MRLIDTLRTEYITPRNWLADLNKKEDDHDPEPERYYEWMLWRMSQEKKHEQQSNI